MSQPPETPAPQADAPEAALALGQMLLDGGKPQAALDSFSMAARGGSAAALTMIGRMHERGWGVPRDPGLAAGYFARAAEAGDAWAMFNLADLCLSGQGVARDEARAHALYAAAARKGHAKALNMLGMLAEAGQGPDPASAAIDYFHAAAKAGDCWAQFNLARLLLQAGARAPALDWLDRSIRGGFPEYWRRAARLLADHPDAAMRARAAQALRRLDPA
ncbi:MAG: hypothetical protein QM682_04005 [Paracoccus sp. (in: a-proteobacteria)]|uniref:tetratricopeptide repeat protein n=1 Tax=Paracoccus sp. TaxID=267 RepID=UPI0039E66899